VVIGSYLGDGHLQKISEGSYRLGVIHGKKQEQYLLHKASIFKRENEIENIAKNGYNQTPAVKFSTKSFGLPFEATGKPKKQCEDWALHQIDVRGLAIWFMDDGSKFTNDCGARFHTESFSKESCKKIADMLNKKFFLGASVKSYKNEKYYYIMLSNRGYKRLCSLIAPYVHKEMSYKILDYENLRGGSYKWNSQYKKFAVARITKIEDLKSQEHVFDIEVEGNHTFVACLSSSYGNNFNGFVVHNCQNLSPHEVKTIITRAGEGTKIVLTGDNFQIDNPYIDSTNNGLIHVANRMRGDTAVGSISLVKGERSNLAEKAARLL
jgi:hypothetical protein